MKPKAIKYKFFILMLFAAMGSYGQQIRIVPDSVAARIKNEEAFRYANDPSFWAKEKPADEPAFIRILLEILSSPIVKWILYALLAAVLAYVIYKVIIANNFFIPRRSSRRTRKIESDAEEMPENIDERIEAAITAREYRLATRFYYLKTLSLLQAREKISLRARSTNDEYVQQMKTYANGNDFRRLTRIYEYVWYGEFKPDAAQFEMIRSDFNQFNEHH